MPPKLLDSTGIRFKAENPKRAGSKAHERYEIYKVATTMEEAVRLGASRSDVQNDIKQGLCAVLDSVAVTVGRKRQAPDDGPTAKRPATAAVEARVTPASIPAPVPTGEPSASLRAMPSAPASSSSSRPGDEVDLSFANLDGKPIKFVKRAMGEAKRLLSAQGLAEAKTLGYQFSLVDRENLSKWTVKLSDLNPEGSLAKDLARHQLDPSIDLELSLPDGFPMEPPFARVLYPQISGGFVFQRGGICFEPLTMKGWAPSMSLPALAIAIKGIFDFGDARVAGIGDREKRTVPQYTEEGARKDHAHILAAHRGGDSSTYGSLKSYKS